MPKETSIAPATATGSLQLSQQRRSAGTHPSGLFHRGLFTVTSTFLGNRQSPQAWTPLERELLLRSCHRKEPLLSIPGSGLTPTSHSHTCPGLRSHGCTGSGPQLASTVETRAPMQQVCRTLAHRATGPLLTPVPRILSSKPLCEYLVPPPLGVHPKARFGIKVHSLAVTSLWERRNPEKPRSLCHERPQ